MTPRILVMVIGLVYALVCAAVWAFFFAAKKASAEDSDER